MSASSVNPLSLEPLHAAPPYGIWEDAALLSLWQDNEYGPLRPVADLPTPAGSVHSPQRNEQRTTPATDNDDLRSATMEIQRPSTTLKRKYSVDSCQSPATKRIRTNSEPCLSIRPQATQDFTLPQQRIVRSSLCHAHVSQQFANSLECAATTRNPSKMEEPMPARYPLPDVTSIVSPISIQSTRHADDVFEQTHIGSDVELTSPSDPPLQAAVARSSITSESEPSSTQANIHQHPDKPDSSSLIHSPAPTEQLPDQVLWGHPDVQSFPTPDTLPTCGAEEPSDEMHLVLAPFANRSTESEFKDEIDRKHELPPLQPEPYPVSPVDEKFIKQVKAALLAQSKWKSVNVGRRQAGRIHELLEIAQPPNPLEALMVSIDEAAKYLECGQFFPGPIIVSNAQQLPLQTTDQFLDEFYDDTAKVWIQDPGIRLSRGIPHAREITIGQLKQRFPNKRTNIPWNCLEMATHVEDGLRPTFLNSEDCRLLTKLKIPSSGDTASRRGYDPGWKEVEKWALLAQGGALTEPHQDSHGYSTYITMNQGTAGFGWLSNPTAEERLAWRQDPATYTGGRWRYVVLRPGQTVFFPSGTVHFVFRLRALGDTLAFGGHVLRCSQIVRWVEAMLEEKAGADITNEDLTVSAPAYLSRVERFVKQAMKDGKVDRWGGQEAVERFLKLKKEFEAVRK